ncbi:hypothetical protein N7494_005338 [Penicillium frequentans]|uniref:Uncharacterized protein n=1 Tax=Penicillium frequentans TaxID=3151616 RepID=A0AAD6CXS4_9EURO|nr:hypothetical protein N7494_005338 [Penicillium glabrum]
MCRVAGYEHIAKSALRTWTPPWSSCCPTQIVAKSMAENALPDKSSAKIKSLPNRLQGRSVEAVAGQYCVLVPEVHGWPMKTSFEGQSQHDSRFNLLMSATKIKPFEDGDE